MKHFDAMLVLDEETLSKSSKEFEIRTLDKKIVVLLENDSKEKLLESITDEPIDKCDDEQILIRLASDILALLEVGTDIETVHEFFKTLLKVVSIRLQGDNAILKDIKETNKVLSYIYDFIRVAEDVRSLELYDESAEKKYKGKFLEAARNFFENTDMENFDIIAKFY